MGKRLYHGPYPNAFVKYSRHRGLAKFRGIPFLFSFDDWYNWWLNHGIDKETVTQPRDYSRLCMCRFGDVGAYEQNNVYCATYRQNVIDGHTNQIYSGRNRPAYRLGSQLLRIQDIKKQSLPAPRMVYLIKGYDDRRRGEFKRLHLQWRQIYYSERMRTRYEGPTGCWPSKTAAAADWGITVWMYDHRHNKNIEGYRKHKMGQSLDEYVARRSVFPDPYTRAEMAAWRKAVGKRSIDI